MSKILISAKCQAIAMIGLLLFAPFFSVAAIAKAKPNVLMILVDDLKPTLGAYGDRYAKSPNIDRLAAKGMRFDLAYVNQAVCMASRYNLMLGSRSTSTGFYGFGTQFRATYPDALTLPQLFKRAGYRAESMGKVYHIGHGNHDDEASWSVPHHKDKVVEYVLHESNNGELTREEALFSNQSGKGRPRGAAWEAPDVKDEAYADGRVAKVAIDRLRRAAKRPEQPFFMVVGFARPHLPFTAPKKYWDMHDKSKLPMPEFVEIPKHGLAYAVKRHGEIAAYKPVPQDGKPFPEDLTRTLIHGYYASVSYMDTQVGRVINALEELKLEDNTIVVLWGDHGFHLGDHGSWTKHTNFEQATRIPLIVVAPGVTRPGTASKQLAETVDIYTTLADLAGLELPQTQQPLDGESLVPVLKNPQARLSDHAYHAYIRSGRLGRAIRTQQYRMVEWRAVQQTKKGKRQSGKTADNKKAVEYELYDYKNDPLETVNLAGKQPEVLAMMKKILAKHPQAKQQVPKGRKDNNKKKT